MKQRDIWLADLNPTMGKEQSGYRPVLIVSGDLMNEYMPMVIICPLTSKLKNFRGSVILDPTLENGLYNVSEVLIFHIRAVSKDRLSKRIGSITDNELKLMREYLDDILTM